MTTTVVFNDYNPYPGLPPGSQIVTSAGRVSTTTTGYNSLTGREPALLPAVNLLNSFNFTLDAKPGDTPPSTLTSGVDADESFATTGVRQAAGSSLVPSFGATSSADPFGLYRLYKRPTSMEWVKNGGSLGNGVCRNERGDWFTEEAITTADETGNGIRIETVPATTATRSISIGWTTTTTAGSSTSTPISATVPSWNTLRIRGSYNAAVFCYNDFRYTNNNDGVLYEANSLFELPDRIDNIIRFIPDERKSTTLTFYVKVNWVLEHYDPFGLVPSSQRNSNAAGAGGNSGFDIHMITHVVNNTNPNWSRILNDIINDRQRSVEEQDDRYGNTFPDQTISFATTAE